jgi:hypothetical protein
VIQLTGECRAKSGPEIADSSRLTYWKGFAGSQTVSEVEPLATPGAGVTDASTEAWLRQDRGEAAEGVGGTRGTR